MMLSKRIVCAVLASALSLNIFLPFGNVSAEEKTSGFIHAEGSVLADNSGEEYIIKGMAFGNNVWSNPASPPRNKHHTADSYRELSELGFNSVRFYLNYGLFESDDEPYICNESGFEWLDENIRQAKEYGIRLLLNMHYPQGGYQSQGNGNALWAQEENQKRLAALWTEIAKRYADEPFILGYGLVNEPVVLAENSKEALEKWQALAQNITDGIRTVDDNHPVFVERMCAYKTSPDFSANWNNFNDENNFVLINDDNVVYEFHTYDKFEYTHQDFSWVGTKGTFYSYPDERNIAVTEPKWNTSTWNGDLADISTEDWQYLESSFISDDPEKNVMSLSVQARKLGVTGKVYVDDLKLEEYDLNGKLLRVVYEDDFNNGNSFYFWSADDSGTGILSKNIGYKDSTSILMSGTTDDANFGRSYFKMRPNCKYKASGYFKVTDADASAQIRPRVDIWSADKISSFDKDYLLNAVTPNMEFSKKHNVPIYCGEFGAGANCFKDGRNGEQWVSDMIDIFKDNHISFNYHTYHEGSFGLYQNDALTTPAMRNDVLYDVFWDKLSGKIRGDVNGDGSFDIADAVLLQKWLLGVPDIQLADCEAADMICDDKLNVFDLCAMKSILIQLRIQ